MRVFVLGYRGFVGSAIHEHLRSLDVEVIGVDRESYERLRGTSGDLFINANGSSDRRLAASNPLASFRANVDSAIASIVDFPCTTYVLLSTIDVYNDLTDPSANGESTAIEPAGLTPYGLFKYMTELVVRTQAPRWIILRLGAMVGTGLWKNSVFDLLERGTLFIHPESSRPFIRTDAVARIAWALREETGEIYNVCGDGAFSAAQLAHELRIELPAGLESLPRENVNVNIAKLQNKVDVEPSLRAVVDFAREWRATRRGGAAPA